MELLHKLLYIRKPFSREEIQQITLSLTGKWNIEQELAKHQRNLKIAIGNWNPAIKDYKQCSTRREMPSACSMPMDACRWRIRGMRSCLDATESELKQMSPSDLMARIGERLRPPGLPESGRGLFSGPHGRLGGRSHRSRRFKSPAFLSLDSAVHNMGHIVMYRDVSKEVESEQMKAEILRLRARTWRRRLM